MSPAMLQYKLKAFKTNSGAAERLFHRVPSGERVTKKADLDAIKFVGTFIPRAEAHLYCEMGHLDVCAWG